MHLLTRAMIVAIVLSSPLTADAQLITFNFTGTVSHVPALLSGGPIATGQTVAGSFTFDPTVADSDASPIVGFYQNLVAFDVSIPDASFVATASPGSLPGFIEILNDEDGVRDRYVASMTAPNQNVSGPAVAGAPLQRLAILLRDRVTHQAFSSDALPLLPPSLADFPTETSLILDFNVGSAGPGELFVSLTSFTTSQVPVPVQIDALAENINALELGGTINGGEANSLLQKLEQALAHVTDGQVGPAVNVLEAFLNQLNAYIRSRRMTVAEGDALTSATQNIIADLEEGAP
jgi:hypothetical protein